MNMREKIAMRLVALYEQTDGPLDGLTEADAVLDALMEPTENMLEAGWISASDYEDRNPHEGFLIPDNDPVSMFVFRAMIQAAKEGK